MRLKKLFSAVFLLCCLAMLAACNPPEDPSSDFSTQQPPPEPGVFEPGTGEIGPDGHPVGWTEESHGKIKHADYDAVFGTRDSEVLRFDIVIAPSDWQAMMDDLQAHLGPFGGMGGCGDTEPEEEDLLQAPWDVLRGENPIYVPCDLVFKGVTWYHAGIRFKGNSSLMMAWLNGSYKMSMRFNMDEFEDKFPEIKNQRFYGFDKISLVSSNADPSLIREKVAGDLYRAMGVPVANTAFCRVFVDYGEGKKYFGLYVLQEIPAKPMLKTRFIDDDGNLYKPDGVYASFDNWNEAQVPAVFDKETNEEEADYGDIRALYDVLHMDRTDEAAFRSALESIFDVDGWLRYLAVNQVISNWDTYGRVPHNFYLYNDPGDGMFHWIPWDFTAAMHAGMDASMPPLSLGLRPIEVGDQWPLIRYVIDVPDYRARYVAYVQKTIEEAFYPRRMRAIYASAKAMIEPYVTGEYGEVQGYTNLERKSSFHDEFDVLRNHMRNRYNAAQEFLKRNPPPAGEDLVVDPEPAVDTGPVDPGTIDPGPVEPAPVVDSEPAE